MTGDTLEIRYIPLDQVVAWESNPKKHDLGAIADSIAMHGFKDPVKYEPLLNRGRGGIVAGNGRIEALRFMRQQHQPRPRGILTDSSGVWLVPVLFGVDAASMAAAESYGIDHNNLVLAGGEYTPAHVAKLWDSVGYARMLDTLIAANAVPVSIGDDDVSALIETIAQDLAGPESVMPLETSETAAEQPAPLYRLIIADLSREEAQALAEDLGRGKIEQQRQRRR